ncbi:formate--tetrahydrofolate ligase [Campylobacter sp.]|uniref:formate--tetrahydrofolate ligase n=1 Tax=Campylobacter sp. TaxID=205 RepID=UPI00270ECF80|nr:formate--tetrahydrofolate ligase [Campylobacter sp.]
MLNDHEIEKKANLKNIKEVAKKLNLTEENLELFGKFKAKVTSNLASSNSNLILVTATNPTPFGEGKTTVTIGLSDALSRLDKKVCAALREPSLGPVFGIKGGATGGGYAQVAPSEDINLHFTGDFHAITSANNLISAMIDNSFHHENPLHIDPSKITHKRCLDMNDRALRRITVGLDKTSKVNREDGFIITAASEIMAIVCLASDMNDLKERVGRMIVAYDKDNKPVTCADLECVDAVCLLLKEAIKPNLIQTLEGTPVLMHAGPFANIAHGCNSVIATKTALNLADFVVTEAGFGAELGAQKFLDIKCALTGIAPTAVVLVTTIRSLKYNGGANKEEISKPNLEALKKGSENLKGHIENLKNFNQNVVVALNLFASDSSDELDLIAKICDEQGVKFSVCECFSKGGEGAIDLAKKALEFKEAPKINFTYEKDDDVQEKIEKIALKIYGAKEVKFSQSALDDIDKIRALGYANLPVCIAKTQYSFSSDPKALGRARNFSFEVDRLELRAGAGFIVVISGGVMLMPGLSKRPHAMDIRI